MHVKYLAQCLAFSRRSVCVGCLITCKQQKHLITLSGESGIKTMKTTWNKGSFPPWNHNTFPPEGVIRFLTFLHYMELKSISYFRIFDSIPRCRSKVTRINEDAGSSGAQFPESPWCALVCTSEPPKAHLSQWQPARFHSETVVQEPLVTFRCPRSTTHPFLLCFQSSSGRPPCA